MASAALLLGTVLAMGTVFAETFRHGGSTATIEQSGTGNSSSRVERYPDGQKIITQDGNSTDITIQRKSGGQSHRTPDAQDGDFFHWFFQRRFSGLDSDGRRGRAHNDAFRERIRERMGNFRD